jgi:anti-sigma regulatory factor (Ser/Thr protein kinase)
MRQARTFPKRLSSVPEARRFVVDSLPDARLETLDIVALLVSELATNVLVHAVSDFELRIAYDETTRRLRVEVVDTGSGVPIQRGPQLTEPHGRGLRIVEALSDSWGVEWSEDHQTKTVWFELQIPTGDDITGATASNRRDASAHLDSRTASSAPKSVRRRQPSSERHRPPQSCQRGLRHRARQLHVPEFSRSG